MGVGVLDVMARIAEVLGSLPEFAVDAVAKGTRGVGTHPLQCLVQAALCRVVEMLALAQEVVENVVGRGHFA